MALLIFDIAASIADCVCTELKRPRPDAEDPEAPGWAGDCVVHPGAVVAFERCCDKGGSQSWVTALDGQPTVSFPIPDPIGLSSSCNDGHTYIQRYEVGALRCVCWGDDDGKPCSSDVKEQDAFKVIGDLTAILTALECCFNDDNIASNPCHDRQWRLQEYHLVGPEGVCAGAVATIAVEVSAPCCPEEG